MTEELEPRRPKSPTGNTAYFATAIMCALSVMLIAMALAMLRAGYLWLASLF